MQRTALSAELAEIRKAIAGTGYVGGALVDGDVLKVPAGPAVTWSDQLDVDVGISIIGATTVDSTIGNLPNSSPYPAGFNCANDQTIINRDNQNGGHVMVLHAEDNRMIRISGFTFAPGTAAINTGCIHVTGYTTLAPPTTGVRIDHCHFDNILQGNPLHTFGSVFGVMDHCFIDCGVRESLNLIWHESWQEGVAARVQGNGSFADDAHWGTYKFWFFEDNVIREGGNVDCKLGARFVMRYNRFFNIVGTTSHGTEESTSNNLAAQRGTRAVENYRNIYHRTQNHPAAGQMRSGNIMFHDNKYYGMKISNGLGLTHYRQDQCWKGFGGVTGSNPWDKNDVTDTGHGPGLYASGQSATNVGTGKTGDVTMVVKGTSPGWQNNQWIGYFITNLDQDIATGTLNPSKGMHYNSCRIKGNTDHTITTAGVAAAEFQPALIWKIDDRFEIRKCIFALDQAGRGKGTHVTYADHTGAGADLGGTPCYPNPIPEPSFSWGNKYVDALGVETLSPVLHVTSTYPTITSGGTSAYNAAAPKSYYNRQPQAGDPANSYPYNEYQYPHPLVSTAPIISSADHAAFQVGSNGSFQFEYANFSAPPTWSVFAGTLPNNVTLNPTTGLLSGTPAAGTDAASPYDNLVIKAVNGAQSDTQPFTLTVTGAPTKIIALSGSMAFGNVDINTTATKTLTVTNNGTVDLTVSGITYPGGFSGNWSGGVLTPGQSQSVTVTFAPLTGTSYSGTITVASDKTSGTNTVAASGTGITRVLALSGTLAFGSITVGQTATLPLTITNNGNGPMNISAVSHPTGFGGDYAGGTLAAGASVTDHVTFSPTSAIAYTGQVSITSNKTSGGNTASVSGTGTASATKVIQLTGTLTYGSVQTGTTLSKALTITNSGNATLTVTDVTVPSGYTPDWTSGTIAAGASQVVNITFAPVAATSYNGTVTVSSDATSGTNTRAITGAGISAATMIIGLTGNMAFGNVLIDSSVVRVLTIANTGSATLTVTSITLPTGFSGTFSGAIAPGATQDVNITFSPLAAQAYGGTITVASDKTSGTNTHAISGTGVAPTTKIIGVSGNLAFGNVQKNHSAQRIMTIVNNGTAALAISSITYPTTFTGNFASGSIAAGASQDVTVTFRPITPGNYGGTITIASDKTSGVNTINCSGTGTNKKQVPFILIVG